MLQLASYGTGKAFASYGTGVMTAAFGAHALVHLVIALIIVAVVAAIVGLLVSLILPAYARIAAGVVFLLGVLVILADFAG